jgi:hypothetical protein
MDVKIKKYVGEPIVFHLHKNRLFLDKLTQKDKPAPPSTRQILDKIDKERDKVDEKVSKALKISRKIEK